jgi:hypothetical protein
MLGQHADQVAPLARAQADDTKRAGRRHVKRRPDLVLHRREALGQRGGRIVVVVVPGVPVAFGHGVMLRARGQARWDAGRWSILLEAAGS